MKNRTTPNWLVSLQALGITFLMFFVMGFACRDDNHGGTNRDAGGTSANRGGKTTTNVGKTNTGGGSCSTPEEFQAIITQEKTHPTSRSQTKEITFNSFEVEGPMKYNNVGDHQYGTATDDAYRVTTSFEVTTRGADGNPNRVTRETYENKVIMFYPYGNTNRCQHVWEGNSRATSEEVIEP